MKHISDLLLIYYNYRVYSTASVQSENLSTVHLDKDHFIFKYKELSLFFY